MCVKVLTQLLSKKVLTFVEQVLQNSRQSWFCTAQVFYTLSLDRKRQETQCLNLYYMRYRFIMFLFLCPRLD